MSDKLFIKITKKKELIQMVVVIKEKIKMGMIVNFGEQYKNMDGIILNILF